MSEVKEVVLVSTANGPVRVNKDEFDEDQAKDAKERQYKPYTGKQEPEQSTAATDTARADGPPLAAPAAPHFGTPDENDQIDPLKGAVAPKVTPPGLYVMSKGTGAKKKYIVVDETGKAVTDKPGIDAGGYSTEPEAQKAITDLPQ